ncbi:hypothetical protein AAC387_Pa04g2113 [Persea americana]
MFSFDHLLSLPLYKAIQTLILLSVANQVFSLDVYYSHNQRQVDWRRFLFEGGSDLSMKLLQITPESISNRINMRNRVGRILYNETFKLWSKKTSKVASFDTTFELYIQRVNGEPCGEGMAFILTNNPSVPSNSQGQWLGIVNEETNGLSSNGIVAIEFDTRKSSADDIDDNHVAVDLNGIRSAQQFSLVQAGVNLSSGSIVLARIQYDGESRKLTVYASMLYDSGRSQSRPLITLDIDLSEYLMEDVYVGFSGSTGDLTQLNYIYSWDFTGTNLTEGNNPTTGMDKGKNLELILPLVLSTACLICGGSLWYLWWRKTRTDNSRGFQGNHTLVSMLRHSSQGPQKFRFKELKAATSNFSQRNKLGRGGFGTVYKGILKDGEEVAVKRVSKDSHQGEQEFAAEVMTISHLRHKNLVKLIGWCLERGELLLVYEFMPNGSLDKLIFPSISSSSKNAALSWERRHKIICGVASALSYLHDGCRNCVLHRDVKSSNVMLDSNYDARLGDFGLARTIQNDGERHHLTSKIAGTPGYIAPECLLTGMASVETDVYGFGVFSMEVACGRRPGNNVRSPNDQGNSILDWLWDLYERERVLDAVDPQLNGVFDEEQMKLVLKVGLACCHPNPNERPSMRLVLQVLSGEAPAPTLPVEKPTFMWPLMPSNSEFAPTSLEEQSCGGGRLTMSMDLTGR